MIIWHIWKVGPGGLTLYEAPPTKSVSHFSIFFSCVYWGKGRFMDSKGNGEDEWVEFKTLGGKYPGPYVT